MGATPALSCILPSRAHSGPGEQWTLRARGAQCQAVKTLPAEFAEQISKGFMAGSGRMEVNAQAAGLKVQCSLCGPVCSRGELVSC